tara:strand:+ start:166 stop:1299 length:1134 start_codon:yes stop_codon:yes gene_type:complete
MAREIREGLMAAATGLIEGFGTTMMRNVEQRDKEEREFVRSQASLMRERIAKGRAKQSKLENEVRSRLTTIETTTPGLLDSDKIAYASDEGSFNAYQNAVAKDKQLIAQSPGKKIEDIGGTWYNQKDEAGKRINPYVRKSAEATAMATLMEGVFPKVSIAPTPEKEEETTSELLNRIFGGDTDPNKLLDIAERKVVSQRGIGKVQNLDLYYARGGQAIQPSAKVGTPIGPVTAPAAPVDLRADPKIYGLYSAMGGDIVDGFSRSDDPKLESLSKAMAKGLTAAFNQAGVSTKERNEFFNRDSMEPLNIKILQIRDGRLSGNKKKNAEADKLESKLTLAEKVYRAFLLRLESGYAKTLDDPKTRIEVASAIEKVYPLK